MEKVVILSDRRESKDLRIFSCYAVIACVDPSTRFAWSG